VEQLLDEIAAEHGSARARKRPPGVT
jgi:hypothetical protein